MSAAAQPALPGLAIGVDVGGTFTDIVVVDGKTGSVAVDKVLSTPEDLSAGILDGLAKTLGDERADAVAQSRIVHATTVATNALLEQTVPAVALITNKGFRDVLEIRRYWRPDLYDLALSLPPPLVPRDLRVEVDTRLDHDGRVLAPLDEAEVEALARDLAARGVESFAVSFLHAYARPEEEERAAAAVRRAVPGAYVTCSAAVCPEYREYERTSTAVVNAAVMPVVDAYLENLEGRLRAGGYVRDLYIMQSNGGMMTAPKIRRLPVNIIESGPAAGVVATAAVGRMTGRTNLISFDMGGTTAKAALIHDGEIEMSTEYEVGGSAHTVRRGSGYPMRIPVMDIVEVGAGGGSIAWIDGAGALRVGPRSAGADPGPVAYGRGGGEPTTTDANLVLGRLSAEYFLGGAMGLDVDGARAAIARTISEPLTIDAVEAAAGIVEVSNSHMVRALRRVSVEKGRHPRDYAMVAFGGAGPLVACYLAEELGIIEVVVPPHPGVASAIGLLGADIRSEYRQAFFGPVSEADSGEIAGRLRAMAEKGRAFMRRSGVAEAATTIVAAADVRYAGQAYELRVEWPAVEVEPGHLTDMIARFHTEHLRLYSFEMREREVELVGLRVTALGAVGRPAANPLAVAAGTLGPKARRPVHFRGAGVIDCPVFERAHLGSGDMLSGPAVIEQKDSTTLLPPGWGLVADTHGNLVLKRADGGPP